MNKKGFTLVELIAVILILSILVVITTRSLSKTKRTANIAEAKKLKQTLDTLAPDYYISNKTDTDISLNDLSNAGLLDSSTIKNPSGGSNCVGHIEVATGPIFITHFCCPGLYKTDGNGENSSDIPNDCTAETY